ncbi:MAG: allantoate amidohydrolase [Lacisediminihabitans sp.]
MSDDVIDSPRILTESTSADRIRSLIEEFAALSEPDSGPGITRQGYSALERRAHDVFARRMKEIGLAVWTDAAGNTIAELQGIEPGLPAIGTGSHADSVPQGGSFDGVAGVVAAMEVARSVVANGLAHRHPLRFVVFAAEEGARFGQACTGSRIAAGLTVAEDLASLSDTRGVTVADAMSLIGIDPAEVEKARWNSDDWLAFIELHIEQGSVLTDVNLPIGIVDLISGSTRLKITTHGRASHTGGTPMHLRADALAAAAEIVLRAETLANDDRHRGTRITVGRLDVHPASITTIPGACELYVDIRDVDSDRQRNAATELIAAAYEIGSARGVEVGSEILADASPVLLPVFVRASIVTAASGLGLNYRVMPSGASHDAQMINHVVPSGMIFVPSRNHGISHSPEEFTSFEDLVVGVDVLRSSLLVLDESAQKSVTV